MAFDSKEVLQKMRQHAEEKRRAEKEAEEKRAAQEAAEKARLEQERKEREAREVAEKARLKKEREEREAQEAAEKARIKKEKEEREAAEKARIEKEKVQKQLNKIESCLNEARGILLRKEGSVYVVRDMEKKVDKILQDTSVDVMNEPLYKSLKDVDSELIMYDVELTKQHRTSNNTVAVIMGFSLGAAIIGLLFLFLWIGHHVSDDSLTTWVVGVLGLGGLIGGIYFAKEFDYSKILCAIGGLIGFEVLGYIIKWLLASSTGNIVLIILMSISALVAAIVLIASRWEN